MAKKLCLFCDNPADSQEHVFPDWINSAMATPWPTIRHSRRGSDGQSANWSGGKPASLKVRCVCEDCNSGWMSRLESEAQPILMPLIEGEGLIIDPMMALTLTAWAAMKAYVVEAMTTVPISIKEEHVVLREYGFPAPNIVTELAVLQPMAGAAIATRYMVPDDESGGFAVTTIVFGHLVVKTTIIGWYMETSEGKRTPLVTKHDPTLIALPTWRQWPPKEALDDVSLNAFSCTPYGGMQIWTEPSGSFFIEVE